ncbi:PA2169 family four-helix-bundle protein [Salegentibacter sp. JZCK2]|uniref:ferritin-like domain-containing protein n=1 Tax=Salegentibacter tibetensis TaxID=2873600 RepID=UPI001CCF84E2|nr:PA2169 family four-helix-bundle protein [Salegentibacter tibetensis]MBZ9728076.1 PA2169 family four-helix-bundle protein [Salegentibacter tibetensis]
MKYSEKLGKSLNELLEKNYDAEKGYKDAAENVKNPQLKAFFSERAQERYDFGHELKTEIRNFGESPDKGSSLAGDAHRTWLNLKASLSSDKDESVLEEAIRGEKAAVEEYEEVIKDPDVPPSTANILLKQKNKIAAALNKLKSMELQS